MQDTNPKDVIIAINDNAQDGIDISWLWDVDFDRFQDMNAASITVSGIRCQDMRLRMKYVDIPTMLEADVEKAIRSRVADGTGNLYVLVNYTALFSTRNILKKLEGEQKECVDNILYSCKKMTSLVQNMLKLNKLEKQTIIPEVEVYDVCAQICECAVQFEESWEKRNLEFDADLEEHAYILADPGLMELVWNNLLSNAIKYNREGGSITISETSDEQYVRVSVADTGLGMNKNVMKHIFDKKIDFVYKYQMQENDSIDLFTLKIRMEDE